MLWTLLLAVTAQAADLPPDLTGTEEIADTRAQLEWIINEKGGLSAVSQRIDASSPWSVTDYGNVSVIRDVNGGFFGSGQDFFKVSDSSLQAVNAYYDAHPDADPQFVVVVLDWLIQTGGAFYLPVANDVLGLGSVNPGGPAVFDSDPSTQLEGVVWLNGITLYNIAGTEDFYAGLLFGQEFGHRWLSFVEFQDAGGNTRTDLLGRQSAHWSYYFDTDWSWVEGNDWTDNGDGTFTTANDTFDSGPHYSELDLYLMGLIPPADVQPMTLINGVAGPSPADPPAAWFGGNPVTVTGTAETVTVDMIINAEGARAPDSTTSQKDFELAVVYLMRRGDRYDATAQEVVGEVLDRFKALWEADVQGLATVDFTFSGTPNAAPEAVASIPTDGDEGRELTFDASGSSDPEGLELTYFWTFGDGNTAETTNPVVKHTYEEAGNYLIDLRVADAGGAEAFVSGAISVGARGCACTVSPRRRVGAGALWGVLLALGAVVVRRRRG